MPPSTTRPDIGDGCYRGGSLSQSDAPPHLYSSENNHTSIPTQSVPVPVPVAAPSSHFPSYPSQWDASALSASVQEQHYGVSYKNDMASSYTVRPAPQHVATAMSAVAQHKNQGQATGSIANAGAGYPQDADRIPAGTDFHGRFSTGFQPGGVIDHGRAYGTTGADPHTYASAAEGPAPVALESLRNLAQGFVLAPGTHFEAVHVTSIGHGRLRVFITLEAADGI